MEGEPFEIPAEELARYNQASVIYDQILSLQSNLTTLSNYFLLITGGIWSAVATDKLALGGRSSEKASPRFRLARWGRQSWFWYAIPLASLIGSVYLLVRQLERPDV